MGQWTIINGINQVKDSICEVAAMEMVLACLYASLFLFCLYNVHKHRESIRLGQAGSLWFYLVCTLAFTAFRGVIFAAHLAMPYLIRYVNAHGEDDLRRLKSDDASADSLESLIDELYCSHGSRSWEWATPILDEFDKSSIITSLNTCIVILSSAAVGLFLTSYAYFSYSLLKILYMLTKSHDSSKTSDGDSFILNAYIAFYLSLWISLVIFWVFTIFSFSRLEFIISFCRFAIALTALLVSLFFGYYAIQAMWFLHSNVGNESGRAQQLYQLLQIRRVQGVCVICTVVFALRAIVQLFQLDLPAMLDTLYLVLIEIAPSVFMLFAFRSSADANAIGSDQSQLDKLRSSTFSHYSPIRSRFSWNNMSVGTSQSGFGNNFSPFSKFFEESPLDDGYWSSGYASSGSVGTNVFNESGGIPANRLAKWMTPPPNENRGGRNRHTPTGHHNDVLLETTSLLRPHTPTDDGIELMD